MDKVIFNISSVTNAMRGKSMLERHGIRAYIGRSVDANGNNGCGYSIHVYGNTAAAERILRSIGIQIRSRQYEADDR